MANVDDVSKLKVDQLKELAAEHGIELADGDKKDIIVHKVSDGITPEQLEAYNNKSNDESDGIDGVERDHTPATDQPEEAAAARAGVPEERLDNPRQNREPKNDFEEENQKVTEVERQAAQEASDMTTEQRVETAPTPAETGASDAQSTASAIAAAITEGLKGIKDEKFELQEEPGIDHRFSVVRNKQTGEVMIRENETGHLSKIQLESLEEREANIQDTEVEELQYNKLVGFFIVLFLPKISTPPQ